MRAGALALVLLASSAQAETTPTTPGPEPTGEEMLLAASVIRFVHEHCQAAGLDPLHYMIAGLVEEAAHPDLLKAAYQGTIERIEAHFDTYTAACASLAQTLGQARP